MGLSAAPPPPLLLLLPLCLLLILHGSNGYPLHGGHGAPKLAPIGSPGSVVFNVHNYGAKGDGRTDDSKAFEKTWEKACRSSYSAVFLVPQGHKYLLKPLNFSGPCKSYVTVTIRGTLVASPVRSDFHTGGSLTYWILFSKIRNLVVKGGGLLYGNGDIWWKHSCKRNESLPCVHAPTALGFTQCTNLKVKNLRVTDSQQIHVWFNTCKNVLVSKVTITAPGTSPNTDGIHVSKCRNMIIKNCVIGTGDDCISIVSGSHNVIATNIVCGPGHGISIGSLGSNRSKAYVSDVLVDTVTFKNTTNGARIKTWQGGQGFAKYIFFRNIVMHGVKNPIIIDQNYCDSKIHCKQQVSAVKVSHVIYENIRGTSASEIAIKFNCSATSSCSKIALQDINLTGEGGADVKSYCNHVKLKQKGKVSPDLCA